MRLEGSPTRQRPTSIVPIELNVNPNLSITTETEAQPTSEVLINGETNRLRGDGNSGSCGSSDRHISVIDFSSSGKHDLHESDREDTHQRKKTTLRSLLSSVVSWSLPLRSSPSAIDTRRHSLPLASDNSMSAAPEAEAPSLLTMTILSRRLRNERTTPSSTSSEEESSLHLDGAVRTIHTRFTPIPYSAPPHANITDMMTGGWGVSSTLPEAPTSSTVKDAHRLSTFMAPVASSSNVRRREPTRRNAHRTRSSPFCPCFSPTVSDSDSDEEPANTMEPVRMSQMPQDLVQRFAVSAEASNQGPNPAIARRIHDQFRGDVPVHRIVEYSHHLVPDVQEICSASYYWGVMDKFQAEQLLEGKPEGTFLLRDSAQTEYLFSVSFRRYQRTLHARVEQSNHRFGFDLLDPAVFSTTSITALMENYKDPTRCLYFEPLLTNPLHRKEVFSLQQLCRARIVSSTEYTRVAELNLPVKMKNYIRELHYTVPVRTHTVSDFPGI